MATGRFLHLQVAGTDYLVNATELDDMVREAGTLQFHFRSGRVLTVHDVPKEAAMRVLHYFTSL